MRDFFIHPAQTNLELYAQAISRGYSSDQCRVPFESGLAPEERRTVLADRFGTQVAELVRGYTSFESEGLAAFMGDGQR